jgi:cytochrome b involved in lipid metabolism
VAIDLFAFCLCFSFRLSTGQDATEAFEDVGHSDEARALLPGMLVGDFEEDAVSDHTALLQLHCHTHCLPLSLSEIQVKIRSCRCSRKPSVWCC